MTKNSSNQEFDQERLEWREQERRTVFSTRIFSVAELKSQSPDGGTSSFSLLESKPWAIVIPVLETPREGARFVMVRQWRHGSGSLSVEFPGGVIEEDEPVERGALRELREETGYCAGSVRLLGMMNPNPAFMNNTISFFLAEDLRFDGNQELDPDEYVDVELHPVDEIVQNMGRPPYIHALMAAALHFWQKSK